jgi:hypothetical protein
LTVKGETEVTIFRNFNPCGAMLELTDFMKTLGKHDTTTGDMVHRAENLGDAALALFRGLYPFEAPYFMWGDAIRLPWHDKYFTGCDGTLSPEPIDPQELLSIASELLAVGENNRPGGWTFLSQRLGRENRERTQGLAIEALLYIDNFLDCLGDARALDAMPWIAEAYSSIIEASCQAQIILGFAPESARVGADARHLKIVR